MLANSSLVEPDPRSVQSARRVWEHGHTKFVLEECGSGECHSHIPLYLNFYRRLAMMAEPSVERVADTHRNCYLWLRRAIPGNLLTVIDRRNICAAEQMWYSHVR